MPYISRFGRSGIFHLGTRPVAVHNLRRSLPPALQLQRRIPVVHHYGVRLGSDSGVRRELVGERPLRGVQGRPDLQWDSGLRLRIHAGLDEYHLPVYRSCVRKEVNQIPAGWDSPLSRLGRRYPCNRHAEPIVHSKNIWILFRYHGWQDGLQACG